MTSTLLYNYYKELSRPVLKHCTPIRVERSRRGHLGQNKGESQPSEKPKFWETKNFQMFHINNN